MVNILDLKQFQPEQYTRNLVLKTENVEIILVCWLPGHSSPVHGHGKSDAIMMILEGEMFYTNHFPDGKKVSGIVKAGEMCHTPVGIQHQIANNSDKPLVTLHVYAPALQTEFQGFDLGYANPVQLQEVALSKEIVQCLMAASPIKDPFVDPHYMI